MGCKESTWLFLDTFAYSKGAGLDGYIANWRTFVTVSQVGYGVL